MIPIGHLNVLLVQKLGETNNAHVEVAKNTSGAAAWQLSAKSSF
jgi:hypothetical protein